jgi:hypothetical protein
MIYNGVMFEYADGLIYVHGAVEDSTGQAWLYDTWYSVKVSLDYVGLLMNVWVDGVQVVFDLPAVPCEWADIALDPKNITVIICYLIAFDILLGKERHHQDISNCGLCGGFRGS